MCSWFCFRVGPDSMPGSQVGVQPLLTPRKSTFGLIVSCLVYNRAIMSGELSFGSYVTTENGRKVVKELTFGNPTPEGGVLTTLDSAVNWMGKNSIWPMAFGLV